MYCLPSKIYFGDSFKKLGQYEPYLKKNHSEKIDVNMIQTGGWAKSGYPAFADSE